MLLWWPSPSHLYQFEKEGVSGASGLGFQHLMSFLFTQCYWTYCVETYGVNFQGYLAFLPGAQAPGAHPGKSSKRFQHSNVGQCLILIHRSTLLTVQEVYLVTIRGHLANYIYRRGTCRGVWQTLPTLKMSGNGHFSFTMARWTVCSTFRWVTFRIHIVELPQGHIQGRLADPSQHSKCLAMAISYSPRHAEYFAVSFVW